MKPMSDTKPSLTLAHASHRLDFLACCLFAVFHLCSSTGTSCRRTPDRLDVLQRSRNICRQQAGVRVIFLNARRFTFLQGWLCIRSGCSYWNFELAIRCWRACSNRHSLCSGSEAADDVVYFGCDDGHVYCVAAGNGSMQWRSEDRMGPLMATPVLASWSPHPYTTNLTLVVTGSSRGVLAFIIAKCPPANVTWYRVGTSFLQKQLAETGGIWSVSAIPP